MSRLKNIFANLRSLKRAAFVTFITAGDPSLDETENLLTKIVEAGADIIEIGMPFSDPMADGQAIQKAAVRALRSGTTLSKILQMIENYRKTDQKTPIILMGYSNPLVHFGIEKFMQHAAKVGVDGLIIVDMPPEEDEEISQSAKAHNIDWIRLVAPTTGSLRLNSICKKASGFIYYVSVAGVTGTKTAALEDLQIAEKNIRSHTDLPIAMGFGIKTPEQAAAVAQYADAVVVGSALVETIAKQVTASARLDAATNFVQEISQAIKKIEKS
jgi:tryptophan synthase alpha chain